MSASIRKLSIVLLPFALTACMRLSGGGNSSSSAPMTPLGQGEYHQETSEFNESVVGKGQPVVMFFDGKNCSSCRMSKKMVDDMYASNSFGVSLYTVDFDAQTDLRTKYGVTQPGTVIVVDHDGNLLKTLTEVNPVALRALIQAGR